MPFLLRFVKVHETPPRVRDEEVVGEYHITCVFVGAWVGVRVCFDPIRCVCCSTSVRVRRVGRCTCYSIQRVCSSGVYVYVFVGVYVVCVCVCVR